MTFFSSKKSKARYNGISLPAAFGYFAHHTTADFKYQVPALLRDGKTNRIIFFVLQMLTPQFVNRGEIYNMKATGIVRRIDDLGRVVIPKEIRRTMRIREGDPLEIYTSRDGEVIFKKYSLLGGVEDFAGQLCETMSRSTGCICAVTDRDTVIAVAGGGKRDLMGKRITDRLEQVMENRRIYQYTGESSPIPVSDGSDKLMTAVAAPILSEGDLLGLVLFIGTDPLQPAGETEYKLAQTIAAFLGRHMEG